MSIDWHLEEGAGVTHPEGFRAAAVRCALKTEGDDLALIVSDYEASVAGTFTTNQVKAACVRWTANVVQADRARAIVCNAGNANACNGPRGDEDNRRMAEIVADRLGLAPEQVLTASTGIIGHPLPVEKLEDGIPRAASALSNGPETDAKLARAIMTTDTRPKTFAATVRSAHWDGEVRMGGACKGSGMIAPNMATMLCFLTTDAEVSPPLLQQALRRAVDRTFNRMTVDGDTSTNDMTLLLASGASGVQIDADGPAFEDLVRALERLCLLLAREVARDGEGATKLVEVVVSGAADEASAVRIARTIAESPLVKTALFGNDPNWGRLLMAAGRAGVPFDQDRVEARIGDIPVCVEGRSVPFDAQAAHDTLKQPEVRVTVDLHAGDGEATFLTCDYSYDYIRINAEYHT
jgi:glutamate N-acetyltransferase/amino-acid N-acetyltransferase